MKRPITNIDQYRILIYSLCCLAGFCGLLFPSTVVGENSVADEIISLNVTDQSLGEVLENISISLNCQFSIDESWEDYPVTASFDNEPLYKGLKRIFRNINNAVIYGEDRTIRIIIYDDGTPSGKGIGPSVTIGSSQDLLEQSQPFSDATAPQPEVEASEDGGHEESSEDLPEETTEPPSEANEAGAETIQGTEEGSGEPPAAKTAALESTQKENALEEETNQTDETESTSDGLKNTEKMESGEESQEN